MKLVSASSPQWIDDNKQHVLLTATFDGCEPMPFQATRGASGFVGDIFDRAERGEFGPVAAYSPPPLDADAVGAECRRRIYAVASQNAQMNMTAYIASGTANDADKSAFSRFLAWVQDMRAAYAAIIEKQVRGFEHDDRWPQCPPDVVALASRF